MKKNLILNKYSRRMLYIGLFFMTLAYFGVFMYTRQAMMQDAVIVRDICLMLENVTMSLLLVVVFSLTLDIHIKKTVNDGK